jgi:hypothetical protein
MKKWLTYISVGLVMAALPALMLFFSPWAKAQDERGECQKRCTDQYQECRRRREIGFPARAAAQPA